MLADSNRNLANTLGILDETNERVDEETGVVLVDGDSALNNFTLSTRKVWFSMRA